MTEAWQMWQNMEDGVVWAKNWTQTNAKIVARRAQRRSLLDLRSWLHRTGDGQGAVRGAPMQRLDWDVQGWR
jgi:hypothetical protein